MLLSAPITNCAANSTKQATTSHLSQTSRDGSERWLHAEMEVESKDEATTRYVPPQAQTPRKGATATGGGCARAAPSCRQPTRKRPSFALHLPRQSAKRAAEATEC